MKKFSNNQSVTVSNPDHPLVGKSGIVVRLLIRDNSAWIAMNDPLPDDLRSFPLDDAYGRGNHIVIFPEDCA
jgi:hypothetical protein